MCGQSARASRDTLSSDLRGTFRIRDAQVSVFAKDLKILDAHEKNILRPERRPLDLKIDSGGLYAGRIIEQELARRARRATG
jgi:hypothetical protein